MSAADDGSKDRIAEFTEFRKRMNERILGEPNQVVRRFFALDTQTYQAGALDVKTKELLGLVASMVLRCDDCISYHVAQCKDAGVTREGPSHDPTAQEPPCCSRGRADRRGDKAECAGNSAWAGHWDHGLFGTSAPAQA